MFNSRRPLKIGIIVGVVVVIIVIVALVRGGDGSPIDTAMAFYRAGNEGNYNKAYTYLTTETQMAWEMMGMMLPSFDNAMDDATRDGTITRIESKQAVEYSGAYATVRLAIYYNDGDNTEDVLTLIKEDGRWKIFTSILLIMPSSTSSSLYPW